MNRMLEKKLMGTLAICTFIVCLLVFPAMASPSMQGSNLLQNPTFENSLAGWNSWYYDHIVMMGDKRNQPNLDLSFYPPDFILSESKWDYESAGKDERRSAAAISGLHYTKFRGGLYQTVYVAPGSRVRFSVWMNGLCEDDKQTRCPVILRAGIDPTGGTDWQSNNIRWVETQIGNQQYRQLTPPDVQVPNGTVTVFIWGEPRFPVLYNAAYADDASLVVTVPPTPTGAAPTAPPPPPTPMPCAQMNIMSDGTSTDRLAVSPGAPFVVKWSLQNSGTCAWSGSLNFVGSGDRMEGQSLTVLPQVEIGQSVDVGLNLTAPMQPGSYQGTWEARTSDGTVLGRMVVKINVTTEMSTPTPTVTDTLPGSLASPAPATGRVCVLAFEDRNGDGQLSADEGPLAGVVFRLSDSSGLRGTYTTNDTIEPHCLVGVQPGSYQMAIEPPSGYAATTPTTIAFSLQSGTNMDTVFGARRSAPAIPSLQTASPGGNTAVATRIRGGASQIALVAAVLVMAGLGIFLGSVSANRR